MNALEAASLVMIPSGYEDGTLGSLKPIDGSGDFTFSRGSNLSATRVKSDGYIEKGYENLLLQSNQFDTSPWLLNTTSATSGQSGYDGTNDAWLLNSTGTGFPRIQQNVSTSGVFVFSVYAKPATDSFISIRTNGADAQVWFDLSDGSISNASGLQYISSSIEDVGNGWYRCSVLVNGSLTSVRIYPASAYGDYSTSGNGIYIQDAQLNQGLVALPYVESGATNGLGGLLENDPRIDFTGGGCGSLLLEPSRTNLIEYSEYFGGSYWTKSGSSITSNAVISPDGYLNAVKLVEGTNNGVHRLRKSSLLTGSTEYTISVFAKAGERTWLNMSENQVGESWFDLGNGVTGTSSATASGMVAFANGWYICWQTSTPTSTGNVDLYTATDGSTKVYQGDGTSGIYLYGAQLEQAAYKTSYIPTYGVSQTRAEDLCVNAGNVNTFNSTEGVLYTEIAALANDGTNRYIFISDGTNNNGVRLYYTTVNNRITARYYVNGTATSILNFTLPNALDFNKIAFKYKVNDFSLWANGSKVGSDTLGATNTPNTLNNISFATGTNGNPFYGKAKQVLVFKQALSDSDLTALTTI